MSSVRKIVVGVDYGTTCTGVRFIGTSTLATPATAPNPHIDTIGDWPRTSGQGKVPSRIAYTEPHECVQPQRRAWGFGVQPGMTSCSWTKLLLDVDANLTEFDDDALNHAAALGIFHLPAGKAPVDVVADYLCYIYEHIWKALNKSVGTGPKCLSLEFWFTVPATWSEQAQIKTKEAASRAGFGQRPGDKLFIMTEPEAAAQAVFHEYPADFKPGDGVLICDCGGGTVDIATYLVADITPTLHVRKITAVQGGKCGGTAVDSRFYQLMTIRFGSAFEGLPCKQIAPGSKFMDAFETAKRAFSGVPGDAVRLPLRMKPNHIDAGHYYSGHILLSSGDLQSLFDPVVSRIINLINTQVKAADKAYGYRVINKIVIVGGFGASPYLQGALRRYTQSGKLLVTIPTNPELAVASGAALRGLHGHTTVTQRCPQHYGFETSRPFCADVDPDHVSGWDIFNEVKVVNGVASWVVSKDERYPQGHRHVQSLSWIYQPGDLLTSPIPIYACRLPVAPPTIDHRSVCLVGQVLADFTPLSLDEFSHRVVDGQMMYRFECHVETTFDAERNVLQFAVQALGKTIGNESLEMRDIDLQRRPWASSK
ncbi:actin-like ATPase domain-containing protein [Aspergillus campestris IBT 28561]|uniref:Actin-like ATPase domain-containing protein n=1 Tax=Aspergillus campestris (strain IBT 28561) TaxID=1392248 RepID=A0A2I1CQZ7_ASPC2|nr:actin-like ATPase domain-containing protein [Aspergillus campestris IBT 28561]PKY00051.1 actin-like ATPase domain-containing protein [Aspergillus campestris IBT 28561]